MSRIWSFGGQESTGSSAFVRSQTCKAEVEERRRRPEGDQDGGEDRGPEGKEWRAFEGCLRSKTEVQVP